MKKENKERAMNGSRTIGKFLAGGVCMVLFSMTAWAQNADVIDNVLEDVYGFTADSVIRLDRDAAEAPFVEQVDVVGANFRACELTAAGLICLQGTDIYLWQEPTPPNPTETSDVVDEVGVKLLSCTDPNLPFNTRKGEPCTTATAKPSGQEFFLGGTGKGQGNAFVHVVPKPADPGTCADFRNSENEDGYRALEGNPNLCFRLLAEGRPVIVTLDVLRDESSLYPGVLSLEARTDAVRINEGGDVTALGGSREFGLKGNERLTGLTSIQLDKVVFPLESAHDFLLGTTDGDGVIALSTDDPSSPRSYRVFDIAESRTLRNLSEADQCSSFQGSQSPIAVGIETGYVYITDGQYCELLTLEVVPLEPDDQTNEPAPYPFELQLVGSQPISTTISDTEFALAGITTLPGYGIDFAQCETAGTCGIVPDTPGTGNQLSDIRAVGLEINELQQTFGIAYLVKNWPDCRYIPDQCVQLEQYADAYQAFLGDPGNDSTENQVLFLINVGIILPEPSTLCNAPPYPAGGCDPLAPYPNPDTEIGGLFDPTPGGWRQNQRPLIPDVILDALNRPLPDVLLTSRFWRCQKPNGFICEALFVDAENVVVEEPFEIIFETDEIVTSGNGFTWGCTEFPDSLARALQEDLVTTVSENYESGSGPVQYLGDDVDEYRDTLGNGPGCGSAKMLDDRWSLKIFTFEQAPCSVRYSADEPWRTDGVCGIGGDAEIDADQVNTNVDDAVFMKTLLSLWADWGDVADNFACAIGDGQSGVQPLPETNCNGDILPTYANATDKLYKCWDALQQPKQSALDQNCQAWLSQFNNLSGDVLAARASAPEFDNSGNPADPANRGSELIVRLQVMLNLWERRVIPSIADGFVEPQPQ